MKTLGKSETIRDSKMSGKPGSTLFASRRKLVKTLAAGGGVTAGLTILPKEWIRPIAEITALPVHAGGSAPVPTPTSTPPGPTPTNSPP